MKAIKDLVKLRKLLKVKAMEMATYLDMHPVNFSKMENGNRFPRNFNKVAIRYENYLLTLLDRNIEAQEAKLDYLKWLRKNHKKYSEL